jgi:hypothetical protein
MKTTDMGGEEISFIDCFLMAGGNADACFMASVIDF